MEFVHAAGLVDMRIVPAAPCASGGLVPTSVWKKRLDSGYAAGDIGCLIKVAAKDVHPATGEPDEEGWRLNTDCILSPDWQYLLHGCPAEVRTSLELASSAFGPDLCMTNGLSYVDVTPELIGNVHTAVVTTRDVLGSHLCELTIKGLWATFFFLSMVHLPFARRRDHCPYHCRITTRSVKTTGLQEGMSFPNVDCACKIPDRSVQAPLRIRLSVGLPGICALRHSCAWDR